MAKQDMDLNENALIVYDFGYDTGIFPFPNLRKLLMKIRHPSFPLDKDVFFILNHKQRYRGETTTLLNCGVELILDRVPNSNYKNYHENSLFRIKKENIESFISNAVAILKGADSG